MRASTTSASTPRILLIEDQRAEREQLTVSLLREGYEVVSAESCARGLDELGRAMPDVVLVDLAMPKATALDVCRRIAAMAAQQRPALVMLGSPGQEFDCVVGLEMGADECLVRPFSTDELVGSVRA